MAEIKFANNATSVLNGALAIGATTINVAPGEGAKFPTLAAGDWFYATLEEASPASPAFPLREIVKVTARTSDALTVTRGQDGTAARAWLSGDKIELRWTAATVADLRAETDALKVSKAGDTLSGPLYAAQYGSFNTWLPASGSGNSAVGVNTYRANKTTLAGGAGVFSSNGDVESYAFLGCGQTPWYSGVKVDSSGMLYNTVSGGSWVAWNSSRAPAIEVLGTLQDAAYMGMRWKTTGGTAFAAIDVDPNTAVGVNTLMRFHVGTLTAAFGIDGSGNVTAAGNVTAYSDVKLKKDLKVIPDALAKVVKLTGYTYTRIDTEQRQTGLIAQDVQAVLPEAVMEAQDGVLTLAYGNLVGLLVEAIKELKAEIEELKK